MDQEALKAAINQFSYTLKNGVKVWAPYARNDIKSEDSSIIRGLGKSSPSQIRSAFEYSEQINPDASATQITESLINGSLGSAEHDYSATDCSGFLYHLFRILYEELYSLSFDAILTMPKDTVLHGAYNLDEWKSAYDLPPEEALSMPDNVPIDYVASTFKRKPANLCNVRSLVSDSTSIFIEPKDVGIGDLIHIQQNNDPIPHIGVVTNISDDQIEIAQSTRLNPDDVGGVQFENITMVLGVPDTMTMKTPREFVQFRRLRKIRRA